MRNTALALLLAGALAGAPACTSETKSPGSGAEQKAQASAATIERGQKIYNTYCTPCHGQWGKGDGPGAGAFKPPPRDHTDAAYMSTMTDEQLMQIITIGGALRGKPAMPSNPQIKGDDLTSLVAFVRSLSQPGRPSRP